MCSASGISHWSALGYYLGALTQKNLNVPVGVISCCQGASVIQSWIDENIVSRPAFYVPEGKKHYDHFAPEFEKWNRDGLLYHAMAETVLPFSAGNVVWYQGESNTTEEEGALYLSLLSAMIENWREAASDRELPFTVVQICDFDPRRDAGWRRVQEAQLQAEKELYKVRTVVSRDICESWEIHPRTKNILAYKLYRSMFGERV